MFGGTGLCKAFLKGHKGGAHNGVSKRRGGHGQNDGSKKGPVHGPAVKGGAGGERRTDNPEMGPGRLRPPTSRLSGPTRIGHIPAKCRDFHWWDARSAAFPGKPCRNMPGFTGPMTGPKPHFTLPNAPHLHTVASPYRPHRNTPTAISASLRFLTDPEPITQILAHFAPSRFPHFQTRTTAQTDTNPVRHTSPQGPSSRLGKYEIPPMKFTRPWMAIAGITLPPVQLKK